MAAEVPTSGGSGEEDASGDFVWQNERYYLGLGWYGPTILERPSYTDSDGLQVTPPWSVTSGGDWAVYVHSGTDLDGWQYASGFDRFQLDREGGRASMRLSDCVRRRRWKHVSELDAALGRLAHLESHRISDGHTRGSTPRMVVPDPSLGSSPHTNAAVHGGGQSKGSLQRIDATMRAVKGFLQILHSALKDRGLWGMPLDPISYGIVINRHSAASRELQNLMISSNKDNKEPGPDTKPSPWEACRLYLHRPDLREFGSPEMDEYMKSLKTAGIFSRGAYGYPLRAGYLKSINSAVFMGTLKNFQFDVVGGASAEAHNKALLIETGTRESDLLLSEWKNSVCRPCHFVAVDKENQRIVIGIRGSLQPADILTDGMADSLEVSLAGVTGYVHEGMFASATFVHCNTAEVLKVAAEKHPGWPLVVTGHSLGGGVAAILAMLLREPGGCPDSLKDAVQGVALGCPCVMSKELSDFCAPYVTSIALRQDFVCRISVANVDLLMQELVAASPVRNLTEKIGGIFKRMTAPLVPVDPMQPLGPAWVSQAFQRWAINAGIPTTANHEGTEMEDFSATTSDPAAPLGSVLEDIPGHSRKPQPPEPQAVTMPAVRRESNHVCPTSFSQEGPGPEVHQTSDKEWPHSLGPDADYSEMAGSSGARGSSSEPTLGPQQDAQRDGGGIAHQQAQHDFASSGIHVPGELRKNLCPQGTGGTTSFDLLFPAGTVLWAVEEGEDAIRMPPGAGVNSGASDSSESSDSVPVQGQQMQLRVLPRSVSSPGMRSPRQGNADVGPSTSSVVEAMAEHPQPPASFFEVMENAWASSLPVPDPGYTLAPSSKSMSALSGGGDLPLVDSDEEYHGKERTSTSMAEIKWHPTFVRCPPEIFGRIYLHPEMLNDHLPDYYTHAVNMLHTCYLAVKASRD